ncbi:hypothetical protein KRR39_05370 [Nocardioides panacis]|uniref:Uncharacterized protein n=1 Tax=Nocardioides panacis TaxID=2849501 RepID=A0A975T0L1_9ACTN|nr:hypothetical protein [Nocardioides panacis]QWZ09222.1 hypothetical protein KRR39_05370 [Nocardioides panacis]
MTRRPALAGRKVAAPTTWALFALATRAPFWAMPGLTVSDAFWVARAAGATARPSAGLPTRARVAAVRAVDVVNAMSAALTGKLRE